jgi:hypothetical protein
MADAVAEGYPSFKIFMIGPARFDELVFGVIRKHQLIALSLGIDSRAFKNILREPKGIMKNPDVLAYVHIVTWLLHSAAIKQPPEMIELIFHRGTLSRENHIQGSYNAMMEVLPKDMTAVLLDRPRFENDEHFLALQAADLLAWHSRRDYEEQILHDKRWQSRVWDELRTIQGKALFFGWEELSGLKAKGWGQPPTHSLPTMPQRAFLLAPDRGPEFLASSEGLKRSASAFPMPRSGNLN